jgi:hypothetical protein
LLGLKKTLYPEMHTESDVSAHRRIAKIGDNYK